MGQDIAGVKIKQGGKFDQISSAVNDKSKSKKQVKKLHAKANNIDFFDEL